MLKGKVMIYDLIVIGAGAAGIFAAANSPVGSKTLVIEKNAMAGKKLLLTGSGQCNLTNNRPIKSFLTQYGKNGKKLRPVLFPFSNIALMDFFESQGLPLTVRDDGKVFPASMKSNDILVFLLELAKERGVSFDFNTSVIDIGYNNDQKPCRYVLTTSKGNYQANNILVATGGASYPHTGSDGFFFACLERLAINILPPRPALTPINVQDYPYSDLSGLTFPNCSLTIMPINGSKLISGKGSLLFTHKGFSGPSVLIISRYVSEGDTFNINYLDGKTAEAFRLELIRLASGESRQINSILEAVTGLPGNFINHVCNSSGIACDIKASVLSGSTMGLLAKRITADSFIVESTGGFSTAMVTAGGVSLEEINLSTIESKNYPGLYFAGEVLDVDGDTGGYNLQFAFSSAICAVRAISENKR